MSALAVLVCPSLAPALSLMLGGSHELPCAPNAVPTMVQAEDSPIPNDDEADRGDAEPGNVLLSRIPRLAKLYANSGICSSETLPWRE